MVEMGVEAWGKPQWGKERPRGAGPDGMLMNPSTYRRRHHNAVNWTQLRVFKVEFWISRLASVLNLII